MSSGVMINIVLYKYVNNMKNKYNRMKNEYINNEIEQLEKPNLGFIISEMAF